MKIGVMFGNPETTTGGNALKFYASVRLDIRRIGAIKKGDEVIGSETKVKVVKNKVAPPFKSAEFDILYGEGISREGEIIDMGVEARWSRSPAPGTPTTARRSARAKDNAREFLRENPALAVEIENRVREAVGIRFCRPATARRLLAAASRPRIGSAARRAGAGRMTRVTVGPPRSLSRGPATARAAGAFGSLQAAGASCWTTCAGRRRLPPPAPAGEPVPLPPEAETEVDALLDWLRDEGHLSEARFIESRVRALRRGTATCASGRARPARPELPPPIRARWRERARSARAVWARKFDGMLPAAGGSRPPGARFLGGRGFARPT